tara:strand:- start:272 stop:607 length:336 start_codon:yes stop_codon:yes gene_type:complete
MTITLQKSGGAPVGLIAELDGIGAASVIYLRMWYGGPLSKAAVWKDFSSSLGLDHGRRALKSFENLCRLCSQHGRRPLVGMQSTVNALDQMNPVLQTLSQLQQTMNARMRY